MMKVIKKVI